MTKLSTTSYAVLGLLSMRSWSTYELAGQMKRSLHFFWPRAESKLYEEPKKLVEHGLARAETMRQGRRSRTVYSITPVGRAALAEWLRAPSESPSLAFEGLVRVFFGENGTKDDLLATIAAIRDDARANMARGEALAREYLEHRGPFPQKVNVNALVFRFLWEHHETIARWAEWAVREVQAWPDTQSDPRRVEAALATFRALIERSWRSGLTSDSASDSVAEPARDAEPKPGD